MRRPTSNRPTQPRAMTSSVTRTAAIPSDPADPGPGRREPTSPGGSVARQRAAATGGLSGWWYRSPVWRWRLNGPVPARLQVDLATSWPANRIAAEAMLDGSFLYGGRRYPMRREPWAAVADQPAAAAALHGFAWLMDLRAHGGRTGQLLARALIDDWIEANRRWSLPAWRSDVLASRLVSWLTAADYLLAGAEDDFPPRFLGAAARQARHLARIRPDRRPVIATVTVAKARLFAALALGQGTVDQALAGLVDALDRQISADGSHAERAPALLLQVLRDCLDVRAALQSAGRPVPPALTAAIERMAPALRGFQLGDGRLAAFNGGGEGDPALIDAVLARAGVSGPPRTGYPESGFQRLAAGPVTIVVDAGHPPAAGADQRAHAGLFAFAMSTGSDALVVNAGAMDTDDPEWRLALRRSDAHSTLIVDSADICTFGAGGGIRERPERITVDRREADGATWLDLSHDAWRRRFGLIHRRRFYLAPGGCDLRGEDTLERVEQHRGSDCAPTPFAIRFHLHPDVRASLLPDGHSVLVRTRNGSGWRIQVIGAAVAVADSAHVGDGDRPRRSVQIVASAEMSGGNASVKWVFRQDGQR